jgi:hypothetical protein
MQKLQKVLQENPLGKMMVKLKASNTMNAMPASNSRFSKIWFPPSPPYLALQTIETLPSY